MRNLTKKSTTCSNLLFLQGCQKCSHRRFQQFTATSSSTSSSEHHHRTRSLSPVDARTMFSKTSSIIKVGDGLGLRQLYMMKAIEDLQHEFLMSADGATKAKIIEISNASKVLTERILLYGLHVAATVSAVTLIRKVAGN